MGGMYKRYQWYLSMNALEACFSFPLHCMPSPDRQSAFSTSFPLSSLHYSSQDIRRIHIGAASFSIFGSFPYFEKLWLLPVARYEVLLVPPQHLQGSPPCVASIRCRRRSVGQLAMMMFSKQGNLSRLPRSTRLDLAPGP